MRVLVFIVKLAPLRNRHICMNICINPTICNLTQQLVSLYQKTYCICEVKPFAKWGYCMYEGAPYYGLIIDQHALCSLWFCPCQPSFMIHKGQQQCVNLANLCTHFCHLTLIVPFVIYYFCSILQMTSISLSFVLTTII